MRILALLSPLLLAAAAAAVIAACGGSSSETPWPVEPEPAAMTPTGEGPSGAIEDDASAVFRLSK
jgi:hypothetical protein